MSSMLLEFVKVPIFHLCLVRMKIQCCGKLLMHIRWCNCNFFWYHKIFIKPSARPFLEPPPLVHVSRWENYPTWSQAALCIFSIDRNTWVDEPVRDRIVSFVYLCCDTLSILDLWICSLKWIADWNCPKQFSCVKSLLRNWFVQGVLTGY